MEPLTFKELEIAFKNNNPITFHPDFQLEEWKDGERGKLLITHIGKVNNFYFIGYRCFKEECHSCESKDESYSLFGHHQIINENGYNQFKKIEFIETKKKTIVNELNNPVFILYGECDVSK